MRTTVLGALVVAGLAMTAAGTIPDRGKAFAQRKETHRPASPDSSLIALSTVVGDEYQQVTVIDPHQKVLAVYHVDLATGDVELRCVRSISWDLQVTYYNGKNPLPPEIRSLLEQR